MHIKAILFDMDGVIYDSMPLHVEAWTQATAQCGLSMTAQEVYMNEGRTGAGTINLLANRAWNRDATEEEIKQIYAIKSALFNQMPTPHPLPHIAELFQRIKELGLTIVLVTGSAQVSLLERLEQDFPGIFEVERMVTAFDVTQGKPHPEPYLQGLKKAGVKADEAIVIENAPLGIQAARAAGIYTIGINTGPLPNQVLLDAGAQRVVPRDTGYSEILQIIQEQMN